MDDVIYPIRRLFLSKVKKMDYLEQRRIGIHSVLNKNGYRKNIQHIKREVEDHIEEN